MDSSSTSEQINKILRSQVFANKRQLRRLLEVLSGNIDSQETLTADLIIRELWPEEVRTKRSADVATEMNRLRHALKNYYEGEGAGDAVLITLPNRAPIPGNGTHERPWITANSRSSEDVAEMGAVDSVESHSNLFPQRRGSWKLFRQHPYAAKILPIAIAIAAVLSITAYLAIRAFTAYPRPRSGRLDGNVLRIMDADGRELWNKTFPDGFANDGQFYQPDLWGPGVPTRIWFGDLDQSGHVSVLFSYLGPQSQSSTLICYSDRGKEKWRWTPGRELPELNGTAPTFRSAAVAILKATKERPPRIVVSSQLWPWWPNQIAILDSNGKLVSEYWHSGTLNYLTLADLDGDGREEIIAAGVANGYDHQATLVVLDPDRVSGASKEIRPEFQIHGMGTAQERFRLLFSRSDLNRALFQYNAATEPGLERGCLRVSVLECITPHPGGCRIYYEFDKNFRLISAFAGSDEFRSAHNRFFQNAKSPHSLTTEEQAAFLKVRCLVGCKSEYLPVGKLVP